MSMMMTLLMYVNDDVNPSDIHDDIASDAMITLPWIRVAVEKPTAADGCFGLNAL